MFLYLDNTVVMEGFVQGMMETPQQAGLCYRDVFYMLRDWDRLP